MKSAMENIFFQHILVGKAGWHNQSIIYIFVGMGNQIWEKAIMILAFGFLQLFAELGLCQESKLKKFNRLSCPEKCWVIAHPFVASKALRVSEVSRKETDAMAGSADLDRYHNGGKLDAFRHTFWMALLCTEMNWRKARKLGKAHERGNKRDYKRGRLEEEYLPDKALGTMDLWNNEVGIRIGKTYSCDEVGGIKQQVLNAIITGCCKIISRDINGNFLDCSGSIIPIAEWQGLWENNRCLIMSN